MQILNTVRPVAIVRFLALAATAPQAGTIPFLPGFTDTYGFTPQSTVTVVAPDHTLAIFKQDPLRLVVELENDPAPPHSHVPLVTGLGSATLPLLAALPLLCRRRRRQYIPS